MNTVKLTILALLVSFIGLSQNIEAYGEIYNKSNWTDTSDFKTFGDAALSVNQNGFIDMTCATRGTYGQYFVLDDYVTGLDKWTFWIDVRVVSTPVSNSYGFGPGIVSVAAGSQQNMVSTVAMTNTPNAGKIYHMWSTQGIFSVIGYTSTGITFSQNDIIRLFVERNEGDINITAWVLGTGEVLELIYEYTIPGAPFPPNTGKFGVYLLGGDYELRSMQIHSKELKNAKLILVGDSKFMGYNGDGFDNTIANQLDEIYGGVISLAQGNDTTIETLAKMPEIIALSPKAILMNPGSNDKRFGYTFAEWSTRYDLAVTMAESAGIEVYHMLVWDEVVLKFQDYRNHVKGKYAADKIIDPGNVSSSSDEVHQSQAGNNELVAKIIAKIGNRI